MRFFFLFFFTLSFLNASGKPVTNPPTSVSSVVLESYLGSWFELVRIPNSFQDNTLEEGYGVCYNTIADYATRGNSKTKLSVKNTCYRFNDSGESLEDIAQAKGEVVENSGNAKLKVNFTGSAILDLFGFGDADYWILGLGPVNAKGQYSWAFVGTPDRKFGWILSRTKTLSSTQAAQIRKHMIAQGYEPYRFKAFAKKE